MTKLLGFLCAIVLAIGFAGDAKATTPELSEINNLNLDMSTDLNAAVASDIQQVGSESDAFSEGRHRWRRWPPRRWPRRIPPDPVPEPATMLLLGGGLIGLAAVGRKKLFGTKEKS